MSCLLFDLAPTVGMKYKRLVYSCYNRKNQKIFPLKVSSGSVDAYGSAANMEWI
jgi:hypothetical protein